MNSYRVIQNVALVFAMFLGLAQAELKQPNILWLSSEDNNIKWIGCYGNPRANTPNIDQLAKEGFRYEHCYANAPVCAPSRSTWITGIHALSMGTHPMRSRYEIPHDKIPYYPDQLKKAGYYVSNHSKTDFNIGGRSDKDCWDTIGRKVDWKKIKAQQPFFTIINSTSSHESKAQGSVEVTKHSPNDVVLRAYHPDTPDMRKNYAKYHDAVSKMDSEVGTSLAMLEKMGMKENTIVIYCSDHGGVLPRSKRYLYESGIHTPLIIRIPEAYKHLWPNPQVGSVVKDIVSFIDMPKTWLSLAQAPKSELMQGRIFLGPEKELKRDLHFGFRSRMDERYDNVRAVHDGRFLYIRNYMPWVPNGQKLDYLWKMKATQVWHEMHLAGQTKGVSARYFLPKMDMIEEFYDTHKDPDNVTNLAQLPEFKSKIEQMKSSLESWQNKIYDAGLLAEGERYRRAQENGLTIYEMVRNPKLYDLPTYLNCSKLALEKNSAHSQEFVSWLSSKDSGVRYWGIIGLHLLGEGAKTQKQALLAMLKDDNDDVKAMSAWTLYHLGEQGKALQAWKEILARKSMSALAVMNFIELTGTKDKSLVEVLKKLQPTEMLGNYEQRIMELLLSRLES
jgi:arylsulfatase A-like enzyme